MKIHGDASDRPDINVQMMRAGDGNFMQPFAGMHGEGWQFGLSGSHKPSRPSPTRRRPHYASRGTRRWRTDGDPIVLLYNLIQKFYRASSRRTTLATSRR